MGKPVVIYGKSGAGKSRSLKFFNEDEILFVNIEGKDLPFKKKFKYLCKTDSVDTIIEQIQKMPCKVAVIDDAGFLMTHHFMKNHRNKSGSASFEMYDDIADMMYTLVTRIKSDVENDKIVYIIMHEDVDDYGDVKVLTLGKLLDRKVPFVGMITIVIRCVTENGSHLFRLRNDDHDVTKTPEDMFDCETMENNLKEVDTKIREFYGIKDGE